MAETKNNKTDADALAERDRIQRAFGVVLRRLRDEKSMTQEALSAESGVDRAFIAHMESGKRQPTITTLMRLARALDCSAEGLVASVAQEADQSA